MKKENVFYRELKSGYLPPRTLEINKVFTMFHRHFSELFDFGGELHEPWELMYLHKGKISLTSADRVFTLTPGAIVFHKPFELHKFVTLVPDTELFICSFVLGGSLASKLRDKVVDLEGENLAAMEKIIEEWDNISTKDDLNFLKKSDLSSKHIAFEKIVRRLEVLFLSLIESEDIVIPRQSSHSELYKEMVGILERNLYGNVSIEEIAKECNVSVATVRNTFTKYAGCGAHKYFLRIKIRTAIDLIRNGMPISEISDVLGFNNPNYFSIAFKRETGKTPTEYK